MTSYLDTARRVIRTEADALALLEQSLGVPFEAAVGVILATTGRVVVSGMGKSGHVGRKIAATLASTGTPAQFVHPAEASHGDLGMVTQADVALVLSTILIIGIIGGLFDALLRMVEGRVRRNYGLEAGA